MKINELRRLLTDKGCYLLKEGANHEIWYNPKSEKKFQIPRHGSKEIADGTYHNILKQAGIKK